MSENQASLNFNLSDLTRQQRLIATMSLSALTFSELGRRLDISGVAAKKLCLAETVPPHRAVQMAEVFKEYGLSADLVPEGRYIPPGFSRNRFQNNKINN